MEKIRLGDRLKIKWNVSNVPRSALIPALILQPLLENAIYHGIEPRFAGGTVTIDLWTEGKMLNAMISNPLPENPGASHSKGNKIAQDNIRQSQSQQGHDVQTSTRPGSIRMLWSRSRADSNARGFGLDTPSR